MGKGYKHNVLGFSLFDNLEKGQVTLGNVIAWPHEFNDT